MQPRSSLQCCYSKEYDAYAYVWGIPAHHEVAMPDIPEWCIKVVFEKRYDSFRDLLGTFVVIIDEPKQNRVTFVTDILGIRPMFLGSKNGRIVFGSNVWDMYNMGMSDGKIDYDSVSSWIAYKYNCTEGSLFTDLKRLPHGSVVVIQDGKQTQFRYTYFSPKSQHISTNQAADELHYIISANVKKLLADYSKVSISLSGGYDSRYLVALISSLTKVSFECITVDYIEEGNIARKVAETLGISLKSIPVGNSIWDIYDQVYHFMADGFPISKFVTYCIAQRNPTVPMINGFLGDSLAPVSEDTYLGKYETELDGNLIDILQCKFSSVSYKIFRKDIAKRIQNRSRIPMEKAVQEGSKIGKIFAWANFYYRLRYYTSNNFLQHLDITEALLPFYSYDTVAYKMEHDTEYSIVAFIT